MYPDVSEELRSLTCTSLSAREARKNIICLLASKTNHVCKHGNQILGVSLKFNNSTNFKGFFLASIMFCPRRIRFSCKIYCASERASPRASRSRCLYLRPCRRLTLKFNNSTNFKGLLPVSMAFLPK